MFNAQWEQAEKKVDPNFEGSIFQKLGFDAELCPTCEKHLHKGICLNGCHLSTATKKHFEYYTQLITLDDITKRRHSN